MTPEEYAANETRLASENKSLRISLRQVQAELETANERLGILRQIEHVVPEPPKWLAPAPSKKHRGTALLLLADNHFDEVVRPEEIMGLNAYNRDIAVSRLRRTFEGAVLLPQTYIGTSLQRDGIVVAHAGDLITGEIHDELTETNEAKPTETVDYFVDPMIAGLDLLLAEYGKVHLVVEFGNHDRLNKKYRAKGQGRTSWAWLFWKIVARHYKTNSHLTIQIPDGNDTIFPIYETRFLLHHGEQNRGGSGIAGPLTPLAIGHYRKSRKHADAVRYTGNQELRFDIILQGHLHHRNAIPGVITGGCAKGYDEYANNGNFPFEPASQELLIVTPERGVTFTAPIFVQDRKAEGW